MLGRSLGKGETAILAVAGGVPIWLIATFVVLLGLAFGSFLNVCISRLPQHESIVHPGSRCPRCRAAIRAWDNVPLLSWVLLRGKCRNCGWRILWRYPAVEAANAALGLLCFLRLGLTISGVGMAVFCFLTLGLAVMDAETMQLPDAFTWTGMGLGMAWSGLLLPVEQHFPPALQLPSGFGIFYPGIGQPPVWRTAVLGMAASALWALLGAGLILVIRWLYWVVRRREGMGLGDAKLLAMIAAWLGPMMTLLTLFLGVVAAAVVGLVWIGSSHISQKPGDRGRPRLAMRLPFGSFLCAAAIYAVFAGEPILEWYMKFFR